MVVNSQVTTGDHKFPVREINFLTEDNCYIGTRSIDGLSVTHAGVQVPQLTEVHCFCDAGFEWGYDGDAPRQLAFAVLTHRTNDQSLARNLTEKFTSEVVAVLDNDWVLDDAFIDKFIQENKG